MAKSGARKETAPAWPSATSPPQHFYPGAPTSSTNPTPPPHFYPGAPTSSSANPSTPPHVYPHGLDSSCSNPLMNQWRPTHTPAPEGLINFGQFPPMHPYNFRPPPKHRHDQGHQNMENLHFVGASPHESFSTPPPPPHPKVASRSAPAKMDSTSSKKKRKVIISVDGDELGERTASYRLPYTPEEHIRLAGSWLECSLDPIDGNGKKGEQFWDAIAALYNSTTPSNRKRGMRRPNVDDVQRLLDVGESRGFPGMLGSLDCMHWRWARCPLEWRGQFTSGYKGVLTLILEAVASQDLWIWHSFFGLAGSNNDINVLNQSKLFVEQLKGQAPRVSYRVNEKEYQLGYYLIDGIYPEWAAFVKSIPMAQTEKHKLFAAHQEGAREDVERAFGVL